MEALANLCTTVVGKVLLAIVVWFVGKFIVSKIMGLVGKIKVLEKVEPNTRTFVLSALKWLLYVILVVSIVAILGVPMASVITVLGTAGAAIALSLQGSLSNLAGGIMLVIFRPFKVGDFVEASGVTGTVKEITLFYTVLNTVDNCRINVPNGALMNANIIDYSAGPAVSTSPSRPRRARIRRRSRASCSRSWTRTKRCSRIRLPSRGSPAAQTKRCSSQPVPGARRRATGTSILT